MVTRIFPDVTNIGLDISHLESNYDGEKSDDEPKPRFSDTLLFGMTLLSSCPIIGNDNIPSQSLETIQKIECLQIFSSKEKLKLAIGEKYLVAGF